MTPLITCQRYADLVGVDLEVVRGWVAKGYVPTIKVGKYSLVNLALINQRALAADFDSAKQAVAVAAAGVGEAGRAQRSEHDRAIVRAPSARSAWRPDGNHGHNLSAEAPRGK
jgi:hypothetical protein